MTAVVPSTADEAVATLYRLASKAAHPDKGGDHATMARVNAAVELLRSRPTLGLRTAGPCRLGHVIEPSADLVMPWGKHERLPLSEVPLGYLGFLVEDSYDDDIREAARRWLHWRTR